ncbi:MAG TPA: hypothetical protein DCR93_07450, partial [Cytophagales bacterium]|nr:hypothetical protein [Cytophagales bacterium]
MGIVFYAQAQVDSVFWFAPPDVSAQHEQNPITFRITAGDEPVTITMSMPANPAFAPVTFSLNAGTTRSFAYGNVDTFESKPSGQVLNKGILIEGNGLFTAVYEVGNLFNIDTFVLKGRNALGREFVVPGQSVWDNQFTFLSDAWSTLDIVATENRTFISVIPKTDVEGAEAGDTLRIELDRGEVYSVRALSRIAEETLAGSEVFSNRPIAVTLKDDSMLFNGCYDLCGDQLVPIGILGQEYLIGPTDLGGLEYVFVTATEAETEVYLNNDDVPMAVLDRGETYSLPLPTTRRIVTTAPTAVMHYTGIGCEIGAALVPSVNCKGSVTVPFVRSSSEEFYLSVLVQRTGIDGFSFLRNTSAIVNASDFAPVPGTDDTWYRALIPYGTGEILPDRAFTLINETNSFQLGVVDGGPGTGTRYGYYSNFSSLYIGDDLVLCPNESRTLTVRADLNATFLWSDGSTQPTLEVSDPGTYWVQATNPFGCMLTDTLVVTAADGDFLEDELPDTTYWCEGTPLILSTRRGYFGYSWNEGMGRARNFEVTQEGMVTLTASNAAGCTDSDTTFVTLREPPVLDLGPDLTVCPTDSFRLDAGVGEPATFEWSVPLETDSTLLITEPGEYTVQVQADNCILYDTAQIDMYPAPLASDITGTAVVCPGTQDVQYLTLDTLGSDFFWSVRGGVLEPTASKSEIRVDWASDNDDAEVRVVETTPDGCISDTVRFPVRVNVELKPDTPVGVDTLCTTDSIQTYRTQTTTGSEYTWMIPPAAQLRSTQGASEVTLEWTEPGLWPLYVAEANTTQDTACAGQ